MSEIVDTKRVLAIREHYNIPHEFMSDEQIEIHLSNSHGAWCYDVSTATTELRGAIMAAITPILKPVVEWIDGKMRR